MQLRTLFCLLAFTIAATVVHAQSHGPTSLDPGKKRVYYAPAKTKSTKSRRINAKHTKEYEYYERVEKAAREKKRLFKKLAKPQWSDPRYFGHKRIPKRREAKKMRYCDECAIRH